MVALSEVQLKRLFINENDTGKYLGFRRLKGHGYDLLFFWLGPWFVSYHVTCGVCAEGGHSPWEML